MPTIAELESRTLLPLSNLLASSNFPDFSFDVGDVVEEFLERILYTDAVIEPVENGVHCRAVLVLPEEISLSLTGTEAFSFVIGGGGGATVLEVDLIAGSDFSLTFKELSLGLRFPETLLARVSDGTAAMISVTADVRINRDFDIQLQNVSGASLEECYLLGTKLVVSASDVKLSLSESDPIAEVADQEEFRGVYVGELSVRIPAEYLNVTSGDLTLVMTDALIGTTGFTGAVSLAADPGSPIEGTFLGFPFRFREIDLAFEQNAVLRALLGIDVRLTYFDDGSTERWVGLDVGFDRSGNFTAALSAAQPTEADTSAAPTYPLSLPIEDVVRLDVAAFSISLQDGEWVVRVGGGLTCLFSGAEDWPSIAFSEIGFTSEPRLILPDGAGIELASPLDVDWNGFQLHVDKFALGYVDAERDPGRMRLSLSAAVHFGLGLPAGASVKGMTVDWGAGRDVAVAFEGIGLTFGIPGTFLFEGEVAYTHDGGSHEFRGHALLDLITIDASVEVAIVVGHQGASGGTPAFNYLYLYADAKLMPSGIPIGNTGLAIYGFAGLLAYNMALDVDTALPVDERYYELFTRPDMGVQDLDKWVRSYGQYALGLGISLGTLDTGFTFNCKGLLAVTFPDVSVLLQAGADFLKKKTDLDSEQEGSFQALLAYSSRERTFTFDVLAQYTIEGILSVDANARAFFDFDDLDAWYLALGTRDDQVSVKVIRWGSGWLFSAGYWFEADAHGIATGAEVRVDLYKKAAGFWVRARGVAGGEMALSWDPKQWEGRLYLSGELGAGYKGVGVTLTLDGEASARAFRPLYFFAAVEACIKIDLWIKTLKVCAGFEFEWEQEDSPQLEEVWGSWTAKARRFAALPTSTTAGALPEPLTYSYALASGTTRDVPMDAEITLDFTHPMVTTLFDDSIALDDDGFETIGRRSGYAAAYRLDSVTLVKDPGGANESLELFGTWQRGQEKPNLRLALLSEDHFADDGSISGSYLEDQDVDDCDEASSTVICIPLGIGSVRPDGSSWASDEVLVTPSGEVSVGAGGAMLAPGSSLTFRFRGAPDSVVVHVGEGGASGTTGQDGEVTDTGSTYTPKITQPSPAPGPAVPPAAPSGVSRLCRWIARHPLRAAVIAVAYALWWALLTFLIVPGPPVERLGLAFLVLTAVLLTVLIAWLICACCVGCPPWLGRGPHVPPAGAGTTAPGAGSSAEMATPRASDEGATPSGSETGTTPGGGDSGATTTAPGVRNGGTAGTDGAAGEIALQGPADSVVVTAGDDGATLTRICFEVGHSAHDWAAEAERGGTASEDETAVTAEEKLMYPNTRYELTVTYTSRLRNSDGSTDDEPHTRSREFVTGGAPHSALAIEPYVDEHYPASGQRPIFTGYDLWIEFNEDYVDLMYWLESDRLLFRLFDKDGEPIRDANGDAVSLTTDWKLAEERSVSREEAIWNAVKLANVERDCVEFSPATAPNTQRALIKLDTYALTPNSFYDVWLVAESDPATALYRWSFTTSGFRTFTNLVESGGSSPTVWSAEIPAGSSSDLRSDDFDTLVRTFGLEPVRYADALEVTALIEDGTIRALLLETPEPIEWDDRVSATADGAALSVAANRDQTRAFLYRADGTGVVAWAAEDTRLSFTFEPDPGGDVPALLVSGTATAEQVDLTLRLSEVET